MTQRDLIAKLRADLDMRVCPATIHAMLAKGMPTVPAGKKPRFHYPTVRAWLLASRDADQVVQDARDKVFARMMRGA